MVAVNELQNLLSGVRFLVVGHLSKGLGWWDRDGNGQLNGKVKEILKIDDNNGEVKVRSHEYDPDIEMVDHKKETVSKDRLIRSEDFIPFWEVANALKRLSPPETQIPPVPPVQVPASPTVETFPSGTRNASFSQEKKEQLQAMGLEYRLLEENNERFPVQDEKDQEVLDIESAVNCYLRENPDLTEGQQEKIKKLHNKGHSGSKQWVEWMVRQRISRSRPEFERLNDADKALHVQFSVPTRAKVGVRRLESGAQYRFFKVFVREAVLLT
jgi:hypothetical protein